MYVLKQNVNFLQIFSIIKYFIIIKFYLFSGSEMWTTFFEKKEKEKRERGKRKESGGEYGERGREVEKENRNYSLMQLNKPHCWLRYSNHFLSNSHFPLLSLLWPLLWQFLSLILHLHSLLSCLPFFHLFYCHAPYT